MLLAKDIMTVPVVLVRDSATAEDAIWLMRAKRVRSVIVDKVAEDAPYGIVTDRDIVAKVTALGLAPETIGIKEIMRRPCITLSPWATIQEAAQTLSDAGIHRAPVVANNELVGILSITDILTKASVVTPSTDELSCRILEALRHAQVLENEKAQIQQECDIAWMVYEDLRENQLAMSRS